MGFMSGMYVGGALSELLGLRAPGVIAAALFVADIAVVLRTLPTNAEAMAAAGVIGSGDGVPSVPPAEEKGPRKAGLAAVVELFKSPGMAWVSADPVG